MFYLFTVEESHRTWLSNLRNSHGCELQTAQATHSAAMAKAAEAFDRREADLKRNIADLEARDKEWQAEKQVSLGSWNRSLGKEGKITS